MCVAVSLEGTSVHTVSLENIIGSKEVPQYHNNKKKSSENFIRGTVVGYKKHKHTYAESHGQGSERLLVEVVYLQLKCGGRSLASLNAIGI
jgi:hypothetical protein